MHITKIHLNQSNIQFNIPVEKKPQELLTIKTAKGFFRFSTLHMSLSSSPVIWQRKNAHILSEIEDVPIFIHDIDVTWV